MIRPRRDADLPALCAVLREVHRGSGSPSVWPADPAAFLAPPTLGSWVAELDGAAVGQVTLRPAAEPPPDWIAATGLAGTGLATTGRGAAEVAVVSRLFVAPAARGRGLGAGRHHGRALAGPGRHLAAHARVRRADLSAPSSVNGA